ncbi:MAG TPA: hypothetical protein VFY58_01085 [Nocardioides sp.]|nr:hypothetical protein [Nocardioides sp.]
MRARRLLTALASAILLLLTALVASPVTQAEADLASRWAPAAKAKIRPGVQMFTKGAQCTGNFVFSDRVGRVYVGYSAHCAGKGAATDTNGCRTASHPIGTRVRFARGATLATNGTTVGHGTLAYSSWIKMRQRNMRRGPACAANDFALVRVDRGDRRKVNPSVPFWGGPTGLARRGAPQGSRVYSYGHSSLRPTTALSPKTGTSLGRTHRGWGWEVYTATPGVFGDSGSGFLNARGRAFGTLSTVQAAPFPAANGLGDLRHELRFAQRFSGIRGLHLVRGTVKFSPVP